VKRIVFPVIIVLLIIAATAISGIFVGGNKPEGEMAQQGIPVGDISRMGGVIAISPDGKARMVAEGLDNATALAVDAEGMLYVALKGSIIQLNPKDGSTQMFAVFDRPYDLVFGPEDTLYAAGRPFKSKPSISGVFIIKKGKEPVKISPKNETCTEVAVSPTGEIWMADLNRDLLKRAGKDFHTSCQLTNLGGISDMVSRPDGLVLATSMLRSVIFRINGDERKQYRHYSPIPAPTAITLDAQGRIYVASSATASVYRLNPDGTLEIIATGVTSPQGLVVSPDGTLYILNGAMGYDIQVEKQLV